MSPTIQVSTAYPRENLLYRVWQVSMTYCDGITAVHTHVDRDTATDEYAGLLGEALEPTVTHPNARHIRTVSLTVANDLGEQVAQVTTGPISCADRD